MNLDRLETLTDEELHELATACDELRNKRFNEKREILLICWLITKN